MLALWLHARQAVRSDEARKTTASHARKTTKVKAKNEVESGAFAFLCERPA